MNIHLKHLSLHNFLSYGHADIELENRNYCTVKGINRNPKDNAASNGSGKSSWSSAISWALTGETIQGVSGPAVKNIFISEKSCYVKLEFSVDKDDYEITRYQEPKSDLKIICNGTDISGKGVRESEEVLAQRLPDLTSELIASIIILGQGLPYKFSDNKPSKRKEILEQLSKSDFMIQDLKERIDNRTIELNNQYRQYEDNLLILNTKLTNEKSNVETTEKQITEAVKPDFESELKKANDNLNQIETQLNTNRENSKKLNDTILSLTENLNKKQQEKSEKLVQLNESYHSKVDSIKTRKTQIETEIKNLNSEIIKLESIKDVCPTCGHKLDGVIKPSTVEQHKKVDELTKELEELKPVLADADSKYNDYLKVIDEEFKVSSADVEKSKREALVDKTNIDSTIRTLDNTYRTANLEIVKLQNEQKNWDSWFDGLKQKVIECKNKIAEYEKNISDINSNKDLLTEHINTVKKFETLVKRDFRGFLLTNVINFIDRKAKEYAVEIFNNSDVNFELDGNNIDISYCGKPFDNLSGGEKQKVDLIIQFALRDMMRQYLDFSSNIIVLDEVFDGLDAVSCTAVLNLISRKLTDVDSIFIISHRADELSIPSDCEMIIIKDESGVSRLQ